jgi:protein ImuA
MEESLAFGGLGAVIGELVRLPMVGSRRLQLAAERSGTMALAVRRWRRQTEANDFGQPTASTTRWRVSVMPSEELPVPGIGPACWFLELIRVKAGECAEFLVRACDEQGRLDLSSGSADRSHTPRRSVHSI